MGRVEKLHWERTVGMKSFWRGRMGMATIALGITTLAISSHLAFAAEKRSNASSYPLSPSQKRYIKTYGYPEQFILLFISEEVDFQKRVKKVLPQPRRIEAWLYITRERYLIFDNGYFSEELPTGVSIEDPEILPPTDLNPTQFTPAITKSDITSRFGKPDTVEPVKLGTHLVEVYRYLTPVKGIKSFTFYDDRLQSIVAGFAILPESGAVDQQK